MSPIEFLQEPAPPIGAAQGRYVLQGQHSRTGLPVAESFMNLSSAVIRASDLIGAGYVIDIWSPTSLESQAPSRTCSAAYPPESKPDSLEHFVGPTSPGVQPPLKAAVRLKSGANDDFGC
jgi:hypothetical protein